MEEGRIVAKLNSLINPGIPEDDWSEINMGINGIRSEDVRNQPTFPELYSYIKKLIGADPIVAHNMSFDSRVLGQLIEEYELPPIINQLICTQIAAEKYFDQPKYKLDYLVEELLALPVSDFTHHDPLCDAEACTWLYQKIKDLPTFALPGVFH